jgi:hypothetical protein
MATLTRDNARTTQELWSAIRDGAPGVTVDSWGGELPHYGYYVGGASWTLVRARNTITPDDVAGFVSQHDSRYLGMWVDGDRVYLDAVDHIYRSTDAHAVATARRELEIYNISTRECEKVA